MTEENNTMQPSNKEIQDAKAKQAGKDVADVAGKAAATYFGGAAGAQIYDKAAKTELGQEVLGMVGDELASNPMAKGALAKAQPKIEQAKPMLDTAAGAIGGSAANAGTSSTPKGLNTNGYGVNNTNNTSVNMPQHKNNPIPTGNQNSNSQDSNSPNSNTQSNFNSGLNMGDPTKKAAEKVKNIRNFSEKVKKYWPIIVVAAKVFIGFIILFLIVVIINSGIAYIKNMLGELDDRFLNFVSGCGWSTDAQCDVKEINNFYDEINKVYEEYKKDKSVEINRELIVATLTYNNPFLTNATDDDTSIDYRKNKKQVSKLAEQMVKKCHYKVNLQDGTKTQVSSFYELTSEEIGNFNLQSDDNYCVDELAYRKYLEETFIIKYYFDNKNTDENKIKAKQMVDQIFARVSFVNVLSGNLGYDQILVDREVKVTVTDCNGVATIAQVSLNEYLAGVAHAYSSSNATDSQLAYLIMMAKNYLYSINGATPDHMPLSLRIKSCDVNQLYCDVSNGCHYASSNGKDDDTLAVGPSDINIYEKGPASNDYMLRIDSIINKNLNRFIVKNGSIVSTQINKNNLYGTLTDDYESALLNTYGGEIQELSVIGFGYPLDYSNVNVTSLYGWRVRPVRENGQSLCGHHNGIDISAPADSNIYAFADGVVVTNTFSPSYGYYTVIGHGGYNGKKYEYYTLYAHQIRLSSSAYVGKKVTAGQKIGNVGSTGTSTGYHLHFEIFDVYSNNVQPTNRKDPAAYFGGINFTGLDVKSALYSSESACISANS